MTELTSEQISAMSPAEAAAELERRSAAYNAARHETAAQDARSQLDRACSDPGFAAKLMAGDRVTVAEFNRLAAAVADSDPSDRLIELIVGESTPDPNGVEITVDGALNTRDTKAVITAMRDAGIPDGAIFEAMTGVSMATGKPYDAATIAKVRAMHAQRFGDADWVSRLMNGGYNEKREFALMNMMLAQAS